MRSLILVPLLVLALVPTWSGEPRLPVYNGTPKVRVERVTLDASNPARRRLGALTFLGGLHFSSPDPAFGGFSAMHVAGDRFTLLSDGGLTFAFRLGRDLVPHAYRFGALPDGPGSGWAKADRDSESMAVDSKTGRIWVGFENWNAIWSYAPGFARVERQARPRAMRRWPKGGGAEAMVRLSDGRFLVFSETKEAPKGGTLGLIFRGDPTDPAARPSRFVYQAPEGFSSTDAVELPNGRILVLNRAFSLRQQFTGSLTLIDAGAIRPRARVLGRELARFAAPVIHDNFEALAATREGPDTILWIVSDDNPPSLWQRALLLKFRLDLPPRATTKGPHSHR